MINHELKYSNPSIIRGGSAFCEGRKHINFSLGYQDSSCIVGLDEIFVGIICDGCSRTEWGFSKNQFGAILGAEVLANLIYININKENFCSHEFPKMLKKAVYDTLSIFKSLYSSIRSKGVYLDYVRFVVEKLTFTFIGIVIWKHDYWIIGLGNGCYGKDQKKTILADNQKYLSNHIIYPNARYQPVIYEKGDIDSFKYIWAASDGLENYLKTGSENDLSTFMDDYRTCYCNEEGRDETNYSFAANIYNKNKNLFSDDISIVVFKKFDRT